MTTNTKNTGAAANQAKPAESKKPNNRGRKPAQQKQSQPQNQNQAKQNKPAQNQNNKQNKSSQNNQNNKQNQQNKNNQNKKPANNQQNNQTDANAKTNRQPRPAQPRKQPAAARARRPRPKRAGSPKGNLKIIPLGGLGEIGKNITYYEYNNEALIVDCGIAFPDESLPGIDLVIPDFSYVVENQKKIKGLFITHGHEDHIGAIPYLLKHFNVPIYGTRLTLGLVEGKLKEHGLLRSAKMNIVKPGDTIKTGNMSVEFINVNHSIPDACALAIHTPVGVVIQTGDFKVDFTPIDGDTINLARFGELGSQGVLALLSDSTNAERSGSTGSERVVGDSLDKIFAQQSNKRIIVATFASNVHRVQQLFDAAAKYGRKVAVSGRSMENVTAKSLELGYLKAADGILIDVDEAEKLPSEQVVIITTGSQGEPMSALTRMARGDHRKVSVKTDDCIILSATPIPGNERLVTNVVNDLMKLGASVIYDKSYEIHVSGHACQDELKLMLALTKPKFFIPVHGEYKHLKRHSDLAVSMGIPTESIYIGEIGDTIELNAKGMKVGASVPAGRVLVDGLGIGDVGSIVLKDRMHLSEDGLIVVIATIKKGNGSILSGPDIVSRGFVYVRESEDMLEKAKNIAKKSIEDTIKGGNREWSQIKNRVRDDVGDFVWQSTKRRPMILPVIQEVN